MKEHPVKETDMENIVTSILSGSDMADLDEAKALMFYKLFKHILERTASNTD